MDKAPILAGCVDVQSYGLSGLTADIVNLALMTHLGHWLPLLAAMHRPDLL
jgi:hypothetical protein